MFTLYKDNIYKIISKDKYNNLNFWVEEDILDLNSEISFGFFYCTFSSPDYLTQKNGIKENDVHNYQYLDGFYTNDGLEIWLKNVILNGDWLLYKIPKDELIIIRKLERALFKIEESTKLWPYLE